MDILKKWRFSVKQGVLFLLAAILLPALFALSSLWAGWVDAEPGAIVPAGEVRADDVYLAGDTVTIDGTVKGDAVLAGRLIAINGTVEGDVLAAGQAIAINGTVGDDIRMAGQVLLLGEKARVADDVIAAGLSLESKAGSQVAGNLQFAGAQALLAGDVKQNLGGAFAALELGGTVGGNVKVLVGSEKPLQVHWGPEPAIAIPEVPTGLTLADSAKVEGKLTYQSAAEAKISQGAKIAGGVVREPIPAEPPLSPVGFAIEQLRWLVTLAVVGALLVWVVPGWTQGLADTVKARPLPSFGWGIVAFLAVGVAEIVIAVVTAILAAIFAVSLQGLVLPTLALGLLAYLALVVSFLIFISYVPPIALSLLGGRWLLQKLKPDLASGRFMPLLLGLVALVILTSIPLLGGILNIIISFLGLGALWLWGKAQFSSRADAPLAT